MWKGCVGFFDDDEEYPGPYRIEDADSVNSWNINDYVKQLEKNTSTWVTTTTEQIMKDMADWAEIYERVAGAYSPPTSFLSPTPPPSPHYSVPTSAPVTPGQLSQLGSYNPAAIIPTGNSQVYFLRADGTAELIGDAANLKFNFFTDNESDTNGD